MKKIIILLTAILFSAFIFSAFAVPDQKTVGKVQKFKGQILLKKKSEFKAVPVKKDNTPIPEETTLRTKNNSTAHIILVDGSEIFMDERSIVTIDGAKTVNTGAGKIVFDIKKQGEGTGVKIDLKTAVIGVKGTKFIVEVKDADKGIANVYLKEGKLGFTSKKGDFKKYKPVQIDEYEAYRKKQLGEYDEYKKKLEEEFAEFVKEFDLEAGKAVSINGNEVRDSDIPEDLDKLFNQTGGKDFKELDKESIKKPVKKPEPKTPKKPEIKEEKKPVETNIKKPADKVKNDNDKDVESDLEGTMNNSDPMKELEDAK